MSLKGLAVVVSVGMSALVLGVAGWLLFRSQPNEPLEVGAVENVQATQGEEGKADAEYVMVGGVRRKASDVKPAKPVEKAQTAEDKKTRNPLDYGRLPGIPVDANPQVKAVVEAIKNNDHPERLSVLARPKPFDAQAYQADPATYLETVEPGRVFETAQPGKGVPRLSPLGPRWHEVVQGESAVLQVHATPGAPVSFTSFDCGEFENRLTSITVKADQDGVAEAKLTSTPGTIEKINVLAGCPVTSGQVKFVVNVRLPDRDALLQAVQK